MTILFFRLLSWISGIGAAFTAWWQWSHPLSYPWPLAIFIGWYVLALIILCTRRITWRDALEKSVPSVLVLGTLALAFLLAESNPMRWVISILFVLIPFLILELLFLFVYARPRYPVSGLSHVNLTLIPIGAFFLGAVLNELTIFLRNPIWISILAFAAFAALAFFLTPHPSANQYHRARWASLGGIVGLHVAVIGLLLPVGMIVHGALASLFIAFPLRLRRYAYAPIPSKRFAWSEGILACLLFGVLLVSSRWI